MSAEETSPWLVVSFDGGGIRGLLSARLLQRLCDSVDGFLDAVDMFVGTSTGGIIAAGLATGMTPEDVVNLYLKNGHRIFDPYDTCIPFGRMTVVPKYQNTELHALLKEYIPGAPKLGGVEKALMVVSFQLKDEDAGHWVPALIHNFKGSPWEETLVTDAAMYTSAAPVYMPSYNGFVDGGVAANNPSTAALAVCIDPDWGAQDLHNIRMVSFGCGYNQYSVNGSPEWGAVQWMNPIHRPPFPLVSIMMDSLPRIEEYQTRMLLGDERYKRLNPALERFIMLDDWKVAEDLVQIADEYIKNEPEYWSSVLSWARALVEECG